MSEVLTEILRVDPGFDKERFLQQCENDIIPNILEVGAQPRRPVLRYPVLTALPLVYRQPETRPESSSRDVWLRRVFSQQR